MNIIQTPSFTLAVYQKGDEQASKLALVLPGRMDTKDYPHMHSHVDYLAKRGYLALSFDPPGTWESPGDISLYTMTNYLKAINELIEHFGNRPTVLMGHSRGGTIAFFAGPENEYVTHIVAVMSHITPSEVGEDRINNGAVVSYRDMPALPSRGRPPNDAEHQKVFHLPLNYFEDAKQYTNTDGLAKCNKPKLFFYGTKDTLVPKEEVLIAYEAAAEPKELVSLDSDHDYRWRQELIQEVNEHIGTFLDKYK
jgi:pimeloyl-ACP methyl ester carboxylesterase